MSNASYKEKIAEIELLVASNELDLATKRLLDLTTDLPRGNGAYKREAISIRATYSELRDEVRVDGKTDGNILRTKHLRNQILELCGILADQLGPDRVFSEEDTSTPPKVTPPAAQPKSRNKPERRLKIFLCHASQDKPVVRTLYRRLNAIPGLDPWLDENNLIPGQDWNYEIQRAIEGTDAVIVCLSGNSVTKEGYIQKEIKRVLDVADEKPEGTIFVIPLKIEECELPRRLSQWQWLNYYSDKGAFDKLLLSLKMRAQNLGINIM